MKGEHTGEGGDEALKVAKGSVDVLKEERGGDWRGSSALLFHHD